MDQISRILIDPGG